ncbi:GNAT family N-acetyltransferase [Eubacteriales bacterium OttesenSCG-928-A19]|nr:GNAT family N-acetyltransferase [Eubacteriales bacterium OttesenSCG-928-A19]
MIRYEAINNENRQDVLRFLREAWQSTDMYVRGERVDMTRADGICAYAGTALVGLITFRARDGVGEILSFNSLREGEGIGSSLLGRCLDTLRAEGCTRVVLITTNDNLHALGYYQRRGFDLIALYLNTMEETRRHKPGIPLIGENGIPLRHEIELAMNL